MQTQCANAQSQYKSASIVGTLSKTAGTPIMARIQRIQEGTDADSPLAFGRWFSRTRAYYGIQQTEVALKMGYKAQSAISSLESGARLPKNREKAIAAIEALLSCEATVLLPSAQKESLRQEGLSAWAQSQVGQEYVIVNQGSRPGEGTVMMELDADSLAYLTAFKSAPTAQDRSRLKELAEDYINGLHRRKKL